MKVNNIDIHPSWIVLLLTSIFSLILFVFVCVCCKIKHKKQLYAINSEKTTNLSTLATNTVPQIIAGKQKYFLHDVQYSSINNSGEFSNSTSSLKTTDHFSYNILSIFKNIQNNKFSNPPDDMSKMLPDTLEDSSTDAMHKKFDKSVLSLQWNETPENNRTVEKDETYSCISTESKTTFTSVVPIYNRSYSVAETFKSTNSDN